MKDTILMVAGIVFAIVAVGHALRLAFKWEIRIDEFDVPMWVSVFGVIFPLTLVCSIFLSMLASQ